MRVFLAGATGVVGRELVPLLLDAGHVVVGMTRTASKTGQLLTMGATAVVCDVFDPTALRQAVVAAQPDVVMHQLTDLPDEASRLPDFGPRNDRIRTEGTRNLVSAARAAGASRFLAQSIAWVPPAGGEAVAEHERLVLGAGGVVLRYGRFYGPGTYHATETPPPPRVHVATAARRTVELLDAPSGVVVVTDDGITRP
jgi:nucleoside-diphosphate-sugar epimerase